MSPQNRISSALLGVLELQRDLIRNVREAVMAQRDAVARRDAQGLNRSTEHLNQAVADLNASAPRRRELLADLTGDPSHSLDDVPLPDDPELRERWNRVRRSLRREAELLNFHLSSNRSVIERALQSGETFLRALVDSLEEPSGRREPAPVDPLLINRTA